jgi:hypothetical protein
MNETNKSYMLVFDAGREFFFVSKIKTLNPPPSPTQFLPFVFACSCASTMADHGRMSPEDARRKQLDSIGHREEQVAILANRISMLEEDEAKMRSNPDGYSAQEVARLVRERENYEVEQVKIVVELSIERENLEQQDHAFALALQNAGQQQHRALGQSTEQERRAHPSSAHAPRHIGYHQSSSALSEQERRLYAEWKPNSASSSSSSSSTGYGHGFGKSLFEPASASAAFHHAPHQGLVCLRCRTPEAAQALYIHIKCGTAYCHGCLSNYHPECHNARLLGNKEDAACPKCSGKCTGTSDAPNTCVCASTIHINSIGSAYS